jgi:hypothetical protein
MQVFSQVVNKYIQVVNKYSQVKQVQEGNKQDGSGGGAGMNQVTGNK